MWAIKLFGKITLWITNFVAGAVVLGIGLYVAYIIFAMFFLLPNAK